MRYFFSRRQPRATRILLIESGSRHLLETLMPGLRKTYGQDMRIDLVTCYAGLPQGCDPATTTAYRVTEYRDAASRGKLYSELAANRYSILGAICSAEPIMTKWKWVIAARIPAKVFVLNENGDYFWLDYGHWPSIRHFVLYRAGLAGAGAVRTLGRLVLFPFTLLYLLMCAAVAHLGRAFRKGMES